MIYNNISMVKLILYQYVANIVNSMLSFADLSGCVIAIVYNGLNGIVSYSLTHTSVGSILLANTRLSQII